MQMQKTRAGSGDYTPEHCQLQASTQAQLWGQLELESPRASQGQLELESPEAPKQFRNEKEKTKTMYSGSMAFLLSVGCVFFFATPHRTRRP